MKEALGTKKSLLADTSGALCRMIPQAQYSYHVVRDRVAGLTSSYIVCTWRANPAKVEPLGVRYTCADLHNSPNED